jgi:fumarylpyruvate hydrolase
MSFVFEPPPPVAIPVVGGGLFPVHRIYCVGRNYAEHAKEMGFTGREPPFFFLKPADTAVPVADGETGVIDYPTLTRDLHYEVELVVAIGRGGRQIAAADALQHIYGYAIGLDMTRRDLQAEMKKQARPWDIGKGFEQATPIGPVHPMASTGELTQGTITLAVNGQPRQHGDLSQMIWKVGEMIEVLSRAWTLAPGDLILSGTPAGVGPVVAGDTMDGFIEGLGHLKVAVR